MKQGPVTVRNPYTRVLRPVACRWLLLTLWTAAGAGAAEPWVALEQAAGGLGLTNRVAARDSVLLSQAPLTLRFRAGSRRLETSDALVWLHAAPLAPSPASADWLLAAVDLQTVIAPILTPTQGPPVRLRVMLDPGHGGEDGGAATPAADLLEKNFVLDLACRIGARLEDAGMEVGYTREEDTFRSLEERGRTAAVWRADAFVSLHANYAINHTAAGSETYVLPAAGQPATAGDSRFPVRPCAGNTNDQLNTTLGYQIHRHLPGRTPATDRGLRRARYQVLRQAPCPAVLVECGFLSNSGDAARLRSNWYRARLATAISDGILDYARRLPPVSVAITNLPPAELMTVSTNAPSLTPTNAVPLPARAPAPELAPQPEPDPTPEPGDAEPPAEPAQDGPPATRDDARSAATQRGRHTRP